MKTFKGIILTLLLTILLVSCKDDGYSLDYEQIDIATIENPDQRSSFYVRLDDNTLMFTAASNLHHYYRPKDGQRVILNYTRLNNKPDGSAYNHDIRLNDVYNVLTKNIFDIAPETQDSIGNDAILTQDIWVGRDFLNIEFEYRGYDKIHFINLVSDAAKTYDDGKIHLEFRHNANGDHTTYRKKGIVSFNLSSLKENALGADKIELVIHVKESGTINKTYAIDYKPASESARYRSKGKLDIKSLMAEID